MASGPITSWQIDEETIETWQIDAVTDVIFLGSKIPADGDCGHEIKRCLHLEDKAMMNLLIMVQLLSCVQLFTGSWTETP